MDKNNAITLSVVMPAYNEAAHIRDNLLETSRILGGFLHRYEIIAVNDGSTDETKAFIAEAARADKHIIVVDYSENHGKGYAISEGVKRASGIYTAYLDSDLELSPSMLKMYIRQLKDTDSDIVIGSKLHPDSQLNYPFRRRIMSYCYYLMLKLMFHLSVHDTQTGIKLFRTDVIKPIMNDLSVQGYAFDVEILVSAQSRGYVITEAPIVLNYSRAEAPGKRRIKLKDIKRVFDDTLAIKKKYR